MLIAILTEKTEKTKEHFSAVTMTGYDCDVSSFVVFVFDLSASDVPIAIVKCRILQKEKNTFRHLAGGFEMNEKM